MIIAINIPVLFWSQLWQLTALIVLVALLSATVLRRRTQLLHLLWVLVFVKSLTLPLWSSPTSVFSWLQPSTTTPVIDYRYLVPAPSPSPFAVRANEFVAQSASQASEAEVTFWSDHWLLIAIVIWGSGVAFLLALAIRRWFDVYRSVRRENEGDYPELEQLSRDLALRLGMKPTVRVIVSRANLGPMVFGSKRPVLILPEVLIRSKTAEQLVPMLAHELLHARRGDTTFGALQFFAQVVWWFHPLVWWASRQANRVCERCCDEEVIANLKCSPRDYARCLLDALELRVCLSTAPALPGIRSVDITSNRVENIMNHAIDARPSKHRHQWMTAVVLALLLLPGGGLWVHARDDTAPTDELTKLRNQAAQAAAREDWGVAAEKFRALTKHDDNDCRAWFMLGYSLHASGKLDEAIVAHKRATACPQAKPTALYNLACAYALKGQRDDAIDSLRQAVSAGFISVNPIEHDKDFASIIEDSEFNELAQSARPPAKRDVYRQFDFWVGNWDVIGRNGKKVGTNVITKDEKGFLLTEKWTNSEGGTGTSINYYDPSDKLWKQTWVDAGGNVVQYKGRFEDGKMSLNGQLTKPDGSIVGSRVSYSINDDGSIRQLIEHSPDQGQSWNVYFDGRYIPSRFIGRNKTAS